MQNLSVQFVNTLVHMTHFNIACIDEPSLTTIIAWSSIEHNAIMIICRRIEESNSSTLYPIIIIMYVSLTHSDVCKSIQFFVFLEQSNCFRILITTVKTLQTHFDSSTITTYVCGYLILIPESCVRVGMIHCHILSKVCHWNRHQFDCFLLNRINFFIIWLHDKFYFSFSCTTWVPGL